MDTTIDTVLVRDNLFEEVGYLLAGAAVTLALFFCLSYFQLGARPAPATVIEDLRVLTLPLEAPPPPPAASTGDSGEMTLIPLATGLETSPSESPVKIAVGPLAFDLPAILPDSPVAINFTRAYPEFRPNTDVSVNDQHIYPEAEVDQLPRANQRSLQFIPHALRINLRQIRVVLLILMEKNGQASSVRVVRSCGTPALDEIVARSVREDWVFLPAFRHGKPVRCFVEQAILIKLDPGSPLEVR